MDASAMMDFLLRLISCVEPVQLRHDVLTVSRSMFLLYTFIQHLLGYIQVTIHIKGCE